ncbi:sugar phosphate isomerase/epimerase [Ruminococcaceae bacterium OttesenSCG-928-D13]|nr:sugar phosphate isomerase/epimerase [Ruminococcaceae bacterium OttesenSCG-928-D13]
MGIKRGVSLYSYQQEYFLHQMDLEACIKAVADLGATGVEIIPEQMVNEYPRLSDGFLEKWFGWMKQYGTVPTCMDAFSESLLYKNRVLSESELVDLMERDLKVAAQLGCFVIRTLCTTPTGVIEKSLPLAEKYGVKIGLEIHAPLDLDSDWFKPYQDLIDRKGCAWFGIIPDMGIFEKFPSPLQQARAVRNGASQKVTDFITQAYIAGEGQDKVAAEMAKQNANQHDYAWLHRAYRTLYTSPEVLRKHKDYIFHVHAKFYDVSPDYQDECLDYENVVRVLREIGYDGYLSSEYEGNRTIEDAFPVDSVEQVRRQHEMMKRLLDA